MKKYGLLIEFVIVAALGFVLFKFLSSLTPRTLHSDVLWYLNMGFNNIPDIIWMNRYTHVFILKVFLSITDTPIQASALYWAFINTSISLLIYLNARMILPHSNFVHGVLGVAFYFSLFFHPLTTGVALVDFSAMFMVILVSTVYLVYTKIDYPKDWLLISLGFLLFFVFKTKETAWISGFVLIGLGFNQSNEFDIQKLWGEIKIVLIGFVTGLGLFMVLYGVFLDDFFYSIRPEHLKAFLGFWVGESAHLPNAGNWYDGVLFQSLLIPFLFYLISGVKSRIEGSPFKVQIIWLIPITLLLILSISGIKSTFSFTHYRHLFPSLAMICFLAPQFLYFPLPSTKKQIMIFAGILIGSGIALHFTFEAIRIYTTIVDLHFHGFIDDVFHPVVLTVLFGLIIIIDRYPTYWVFIPVFCIIALLFHPIKRNYREMTVPAPNTSFQYIFYPFEKFQDKIEPRQDMLFYVSKSLPNELNLASDNIDTLYSAFDLQFKTSTGRDTFTYQPPINQLEESIISGSFTYLLLTENDWESLDIERYSRIQDMCKVYYDKEKPIILLDCTYP